MSEIFTIEPTSLFIYVFWAVIGSMFVRVFNSLWRNFETSESSFRRFGRILLGLGYREENCKVPIAADYLLAFILGILELLAYPILLRTNHPAFIGAWLAFKTVHRWHYASEYKRGSFNRYLVSNAFILCISYWLARSLFDCG